MRNYIYLCLFFLQISFALYISMDEKVALIDFYNATKGKEWKEEWDLSKSVSTWKGVSILEGNVIAIVLPNNNLSGTLPDSFGKISKLKVLNLQGNQISGTSPNSFSKLSLLEHCNLSFNQMKGNLPNNLGDLKQLRNL